MLDVTAFTREGAKTSRGNHTVVVRDSVSGVAILIVRSSGSLTEIMTPDMPEFKRTVGLLSAASGISLTVPPEVKTES